MSGENPKTKVGALFRPAPSTPFVRALPGDLVLNLIPPSIPRTLLAAGVNRGGSGGKPGPYDGSRLCAALLCDACVSALCALWRQALSADPRSFAPHRLTRLIPRCSSPVGSELPGPGGCSLDGFIATMATYIIFRYFFFFPSVFDFDFRAGGPFFLNLVFSGCPCCFSLSCGMA